MMGDFSAPPKIFLSYAREDFSSVEYLYDKLYAAGCVPWMDKKDILPGEVWFTSIKNAIQDSDFFLACLSTHSVNKRGVIQKEIRAALDSWQGMLDGDIYLIPVRLDDCPVPESMSKFQWVDLFAEDGLLQLEKAIYKGMERRGKFDGIDPEIVASNNRKEEKLPLMKSNKVSFFRRNIYLRITSLLLGGLLIGSGIPWFYNNYIYHVERPDIPEACQENIDPVQVGIANLLNCSSTFQQQVFENWTNEILVVNSIHQVFETSNDARKQNDYDVVVWGSCDSIRNESASLHFELITSRKPYGTYEPLSLSVTGDLEKIIRTGKALFAYVYGNYSEAAYQFENLPEVETSIEFSLFRANSYLFLGQYGNAISAYDEINRTIVPPSAAVYNNLGVALFNQDRSQGLGQFDQAVYLAETFSDIDIESIALVNRSDVYRLKTEWESSFLDCIDARDTNAQSSLPYLCFASYKLFYYRTHFPWLLPLNDINRNLNNAERYDASSAMEHYLRAYWHLSHFWKQKKEAVDEYVNYLAEMDDNVCLQFDLERVEIAKTNIDNLTKPTLSTR